MALGCVTTRRQGHKDTDSLSQRRRGSTNAEIIHGLSGSKHNKIIYSFTSVEGEDTMGIWPVCMASEFRGSVSDELRGFGAPDGVPVRTNKQERCCFSPDRNAQRLVK